MAFNSTTYRANKYRKKAWSELAEARAIRARVLSDGERYGWERPRIATFVTLARLSMRLHLSLRKTRTST